ncbi:DUF3443 domain-containing protein [Paraburkholderia bonniea]|uniref:DUF3443 domain-containing protein n=1 Tax=Paraburkholderia bonniea TaxID=2152891 RepID=UPI001FE8B0A5|nr:DUF3443 domain-containing protein [Paraburkholderia bonniea]WJF90415.1 DUF3443 domain-containing protein [Paraburkholderia bonniea]WJF93730.1 DUF3443 domain-containing protein [Paraburkholderia bonniea]
MRLILPSFNSVASTLGCVALLALASCGGGDGSGSLPPGPDMQPIVANASNTVPITVDQGLASGANIPTVSVTVCAPGSSTNCQTINQVQLDTGSYGLRILSSALGAPLKAGLPRTGSALGPLAQCAKFAIGYAWGSVRTADVKIGGETALNLPIQVIGDLPDSSVPANGCVNGPAQNSVSNLGANGILGVGVAPYDCGGNCLSAVNSLYYTCPSGGAVCRQVGVPLQQQVANPVPRFAVNNNGVIVQLPAVPTNGAASVNGTLVFGIGTQPNNIMQSAAQLFLTDSFGNLGNSSFNGQPVVAFFDSGSNANFFADPSLPLCGQNYAGFYCPPFAQTRNLTVVGATGVQANVSFNVVSAATLFGVTSRFAFNNLAGQTGFSGTVDMGLPFFYGRYVYYGMDQRLWGGSAPYVAF